MPDAPDTMRSMVAIGHAVNAAHLSVQSPCGMVCSAETHMQRSWGGHRPLRMTPMFKVRNTIAAGLGLLRSF